MADKDSRRKKGRGLGIGGGGSKKNISMGHPGFQPSANPGPEPVIAGRISDGTNMNVAIGAAEQFVKQQTEETQNPSQEEAFWKENEDLAADYYQIEHQKNAIEKASAEEKAALIEQYGDPEERMTQWSEERDRRWDSFSQGQEMAALANKYAGKQTESESQDHEKGPEDDELGR